MKPGIYQSGREALLFLGGLLLVTYAIAGACYALGKLTIALFNL